MDFEAVIDCCAHSKRKDSYGTWITAEMKEAYIGLHHLGYAQSVEVWREKELVGGLYGISIGKAFFWRVHVFTNQQCIKNSSCLPCRVFNKK